jgi:hypothetical protein
MDLDVKDDLKRAGAQDQDWSLNLGAEKNKEGTGTEKKAHDGDGKEETAPGREGEIYVQRGRSVVLSNLDTNQNHHRNNNTNDRPMISREASANYVSSPVEIERNPSIQSMALVKKSAAPSSKFCPPALAGS